MVTKNKWHLGNIKVGFLVKNLSLATLPPPRNINLPVAVLVLHVGTASQEFEIQKF